MTWMARQPHYELVEIQARAASPGTRSVSTRAFVDAQALGVDSAGVWKCVQSLGLQHFYKAMISEKFPDSWQDVYKIRYGGNPIYLKVQLLDNGNVHVISFKEDTSS